MSYPGACQRSLATCLFVSKRSYRIDRHRPPRGYVTCRKSDNRNQRRRRHERQRIVWRGVPQLIRQQPAGGEARQQSDHNPCREQLHAMTQHRAQDVPTAGAEGDPYGDLLRLPRDGVRHHAEHTNSHEQGPDARKKGKHNQAEPRLRVDPLAEDVREASWLSHGGLAIDGGDFTADGIQQLQRVAWRPHDNDWSGTAGYCSGYVNVRRNRLLDPVVSHVFNDACDLQLSISRWRGRHAELLTDWILIPEVRGGKRLIDDSQSRWFAEGERRKAASPDEANAEDAEMILRAQLNDSP